MGAAGIAVSSRHDWVTYTCVCGFRLERVPRDVVQDLPRCLGCGRSLRRGASSVRTTGIADVRDLR